MMALYLNPLRFSGNSSTAVKMQGSPVTPPSEPEERYQDYLQKLTALRELLRDNPEDKTGNELLRGVSYQYLKLNHKSYYSQFAEEFKKRLLSQQDYPHLIADYLAYQPIDKINIPDYLAYKPGDTLNPQRTPQEQQTLETFKKEIQNALSAWDPVYKGFLPEADRSVDPPSAYFLNLQTNLWLRERCHKLDTPSKIEKDLNNDLRKERYQKLIPQIMKKTGSVDKALQKALKSLYFEALKTEQKDPIEDFNKFQTQPALLALILFNLTKKNPQLQKTLDLLLDATTADQDRFSPLAKQVTQLMNGKSPLDKELASELGALYLATLPDANERALTTQAFQELRKEPVILTMVLSHLADKDPKFQKNLKLLFSNTIANKTQLKALVKNLSPILKRESAIEKAITREIGLLYLSKAINTQEKTLAIEAFKIFRKKPLLLAQVLSHLANKDPKFQESLDFLLNYLPKNKEQLEHIKTTIHKLSQQRKEEKTIAPLGALGIIYARLYNQHVGWDLKREIIPLDTNGIPKSYANLILQSTDNESSELNALVSIFFIQKMKGEILEAGLQYPNNTPERSRLNKKEREAANQRVIQASQNINAFFFPETQSKQTKQKRSTHPVTQ